MSDIGFIIFYVENVARSAEFYSRLLEQPVTESSPNFAMLPAGPNCMLGLWRRDAVEPEARGGPGAMEIAFVAPDDAAVHAAHARWASLGADIAQPPTRLDFGFACVALDPDGHRIRAFAPAG